VTLSNQHGCWPHPLALGGATASQASNWPTRAPFASQMSNYQIFVAGEWRMLNIFEWSKDFRCLPGTLACWGAIP